jgi:hypothetical protein
MTFGRRQQLGPICAGLRNGGRLQGIGGSGFGRNDRSSERLADDLHDAAFGKTATKLASAEWHKAHDKETQ